MRCVALIFLPFSRRCPGVSARARAGWRIQARRRIRGFLQHAGGTRRGPSTIPVHQQGWRSLRTAPIAPGSPVVAPLPSLAENDGAGCDPSLGERQADEQPEKAEQQTAHDVRSKMDSDEDAAERDQRDQDRGPERKPQARLPAGDLLGDAIAR